MYKSLEQYDGTPIATSREPEEFAYFDYRAPGGFGHADHVNQLLDGSSNVVESYAEVLEEYMEHYDPKFF